MAYTQRTARLVARLRADLALVADQQTRDLVQAWVVAWNEIQPDLNATLLEMLISDDQVTRATDRLTVCRPEDGAVRDLELEHEAGDAADEADCAVAVVDRAARLRRIRGRREDRLPGRTRCEDSRDVDVVDVVTARVLHEVLDDGIDGHPRNLPAPGLGIGVACELVVIVDDGLCCAGASRS